MSTLLVFGTVALLNGFFIISMIFLFTAALSYVLRGKLPRKPHLVLISVFAWSASEAAMKFMHFMYLLLFRENSLIDAYRSYMVLTYLEFVLASFLTQYIIVLSLKKSFKTYLITWGEILSFTLPWVVLQAYHLKFLYHLDTYPVKTQLTIYVVFTIQGLVMMQYISAQVISTRYELYSAILRVIWETSIFSAFTRNFILYDTYLLHMLGIATLLMGVLLYVLHPLSEYRIKYEERMNALKT